MPDPANTCRWCKVPFPSRNAIFRHVRDTPECARAAAEEDGRATAVLAEGAVGRPKVHAALFLVSRKDFGKAEGGSIAGSVLSQSLARAGARNVLSFPSANPAMKTKHENSQAVLVASFECSCAEHTAFCGTELLHRTYSAFACPDIARLGAVEKMVILFATMVPPSCKLGIEELVQHDFSHLLPLSAFRNTDSSSPPLSSYELAQPARISQSDLHRLVTVVVTTSPMRSDPDLDILSTTLGSLSFAGLQDCRKILVCDHLDLETHASPSPAQEVQVKREERAHAQQEQQGRQEHAQTGRQHSIPTLAPNEPKFRGFKRGHLPREYLDRYSERLSALRRAHWVRAMGVELLELQSWHGFALATLRALEAVRTPLVCGGFACP